MWNFILSLFRKPKYGLILDSPDAFATLPEHELFAGGGTNVMGWKSLCPPFRWQGASMWCTAYAGTSIGYAFEKASQGGSPLFSPMELFYRSGGGVNGNYLIATAKAMTLGLVKESDVPTVVPNGWDLETFLRLKPKAKASVSDLEVASRYAMKSAASVKCDKASLRSALQSSPLMVAVGVGKGYWATPAPKPDAYGAYHAVVLVDIDADGCYLVFDSLTAHQGFDGFHILGNDYEILSALSFIDLPDDWRTIQEQEQAIRHYDALAHYGSARDLKHEQFVAQSMSAELKRHPTLTAYFGREWTVAVNAVAYGGYTVTDLLNHYCSMRRWNRPIYNLNYPRNGQP